MFNNAENSPSAQPPDGTTKQSADRGPAKALQDGLVEALRQLRCEDAELFGLPIKDTGQPDWDRKLHEVCINHKLAEHLAEHVLPLFGDKKQLFVDIEFNREGGNLKKTVVAGQPVSVRPDIIIHNRRSKEHKINILVAECKKSGSSSAEIEKDKQRIVSLMTDKTYEYRFGLQVLYDLKGIKGTLFYKDSADNSIKMDQFAV